MGEWQSTLEGVVMNTTFWRGKKVLLTGHTGFKGSWLSLWLQHAGADLCGVALAPNTQPNLFELADVAAGMHSHLVDIRDALAVRQVMNAFKPEIVIHMAAQPLVRYSYDFPVETYATNVMGTVHVLEAARHCDSVRVVLNVTTDKCYENQEWVWGYRENEPMGGLDPYSNSKGCSELVTHAYRHSFYKGARKGLASARAGNVIGGGDWALDRLVPDIMNSIARHQPVVVRNPGAIRPWQHVLEPLSGYLLLTEKLWDNPGRFSEGWNFGPYMHETANVQTVVEKILAHWGPGHGGWSNPSAGMAPHEAHSLKLDITKACSELGWKPRLSLDESLQWLVEWYKAWLNKEDLNALTLVQIKQYQDKIGS